MTPAKFRLGRNLDRRMALKGFRTQQVRLGRLGVFPVMPYVGHSYTGDDFNNSRNRDPGMGIEEALVVVQIRITVPYDSMAAAALLEGITVKQAVSVGQVWYYREQPSLPWQPFQVGKEADSNNCRWLLSLADRRV